MKTFQKLLIGILSLFAALFVLTLTGCSEDNPVGDDSNEVEPVGLLVTDGSTEVVRVENGVVTGKFDLTAGQLSAKYRLQFIDDKGNLFDVDEPDHTPGSTIADPSVVELLRDQPTDWNFQLRGLKEGSTTITLTIIHGTHDDFVSPAIPVIVAQ